MRVLLFILLLFTMIGCNPGKNPGKNPGLTIEIKPDSLIPEAQMIRILTDLHLTEGALAYLKNHGKDNKDLARQYYNVLFSKYKISKKRFSENLEYYQGDQENFLKMYNEVIKQLNALSPKEKRGEGDE